MAFTHVKRIQRFSGFIIINKKEEDYYWINWKIKKKNWTVWLACEWCEGDFLASSLDFESNQKRVLLNKFSIDKEIDLCYKYVVYF